VAGGAVDQEGDDVPDSERILIVGAGPCGLGCARTLDALGHRDWMILEAGTEVGGLAGSVVDPAGFTWDHGGHVVFSHYGEFDRLLEETLGEDVERHERVSYVRFGDGWVPYPFQNNLHRLPPEVALECVMGLIDAKGSPTDDDFASWVRARFGEGIARHFLEPYNRKVWVADLADLSSNWMAERVPEIDVTRALNSIIRQQDDVAWGPNSRFSFPARGGTGEIYRRAGGGLLDRIRLRAEVVAVDAVAKQVVLGDGERVDYGALVTTMPLDLLVARLVDAPDEVRTAAKDLVHTSVTIVGLGYEAPLDARLSWAYFPQHDVPFYRATNFGGYAAANVPGGDTGRYSSWMTEIAHRPGTDPPDDLEHKVDAALRDSGLVPGDAPIASVYRRLLPYAYPVPTRGRDDALAVIQPWLGAQGIRSRGRFGAWRYELGNMDHAVKMGVDVAREVLLGEPEVAWS